MRGRAAAPRPILGEHRPCRGKVARTRHQPAADDDDAFGADGGGLVDHLLVVVDGLLELVGAAGANRPPRQ
jgi:hypothetical protein